MANNSKLNVAARRALLQEHEAKGTTSTAKLASLAGVSVRQVQRDLAAMDLAARKHATISDRRVMTMRRQLQKAEARYRELEAAWQRSKVDKRRSRTTARHQAGAGELQRVETTENQLGRVAFMREMRAIDEHVARLLGLFAPTNLERTGRNGGPVHIVPPTEGEISAIRAKLLAELGLPPDDENRLSAD